MSSSPPASTGAFAHRASQFKSNPLSEPSSTARRLEGREAEQKLRRTAQIKAQRLESITHASHLLQDDPGDYTSSSHDDNNNNPSSSALDAADVSLQAVDPMEELEDLGEMALDSDGEAGEEKSGRKGKGKARTNRRYKGKNKKGGRHGEEDGKGGATTGERKRDRKERAASDPLKNVLTQATLFPLPAHHHFLAQAQPHSTSASSAPSMEAEPDLPPFLSDGLPSNLTTSCLALSPIPRGKRCLCVVGPFSNPAATLHSRISARVLMRWSGCGLPGETVLDCVLDDGWKTNGILHVIDILRWRALSIASSEASFRQFFLISRLAELPPSAPPPASTGRYAFPVNFRPIPCLFPPVNLSQWRGLAIAGAQSVRDDEQRAGGVKGKGMGHGMVVMESGCEYLYGDETPVPGKDDVKEGEALEMAAKVGWVGGDGWEAFGHRPEAYRSTRAGADRLERYMTANRLDPQRSENIVQILSALSYLKQTPYLAAIHNQEENGISDAFRLSPFAFLQTPSPEPSPLMQALLRAPPPAATAASQQQHPTLTSAPDGVGSIAGSGGAEGTVGTLAVEPKSMGFIEGLMDQNPIFSAGAGLMGITAVLAAGRRLVNTGASLAQRRLLVSLEIPSHDHSYPWFLEWMARNSEEALSSASPASRLPTSSTSSSSPASSAAASPTGGLGSVMESTGWLRKLNAIRGLKSHELSVETSYKKHDNGSSEALFSLVPGPGTHYFKYKGAWMQVQRERSSKQIDLHSGSPWETVTLTTLSRDRNLFPSLLAEARALAQKGEEGKTVVYTSWGLEWKPFGKPRRRREMGSVVLDKGVGERVEEDLKKFMGRGQWYADRGIPYRRGYLLHGPPGSGKSSYIQALAGALSYNICLLNLSDRGLTDDRLHHLMSLVPERSFVLLEDIDAAFSKRQQSSEDGYQSTITFSGLLNTLDGVASSDSRVIFMTTNHFTSLDPALVRPGRVDLVEYLGDASPHQARELVRRFYSEEEGSHAVEEMADKVAKEVEREGRDGDRALSMAALQGLLIRCELGDLVVELKGLFQEKGRAMRVEKEEKEAAAALEEKEKIR